MKKIWMGLAFVAGCLFLVFMVLRITGAMRILACPTGANEPNIRVGERIFASNLKKPKRFDFICFESTGEYAANKGIYVYRLCGLPGDTIQVVDGVLLINHQAEKTIRTFSQFGISDADLQKFEDIDEKIVNSATNMQGNPLTIIYTTDSVIKASHITAQKVIFNKDFEDEDILKKWGEKWNMDQFGPVVVPPNSYFVLGDNRHNAEDSRYIGFVPIKDFKYTVFW